MKIALTSSSCLLVCLAAIPSSVFAFLPAAFRTTTVASTTLLKAQWKNHEQQPQEPPTENNNTSRRNLLKTVAVGTISVTLSRPSLPAFAAAAAVQDSLDIDNFLRTGVDAGGNMGVSSQAGKSRPQTGIVFRDGSDVAQDARSGQVSAEILTGTKANPNLVLASFVSKPYRLETGPVFDVECRDAATGDGIFMAVTPSLTEESTKMASVQDIPNSILLQRLFDPTGRFSFYGPPTDIKVKKRRTVTDNKVELELQFSNLSQSTNAEIPRKALLTAVLPPGTDNAVILVGSANASRWKQAEPNLRQAMESFQAIPAPKSNLKLRAKDRSNNSDLLF